MSTEISTVETTALVSHRAATNAAGLCRELVVKTAMKIQNRRYVQVEGWQAIANTFGCVASAKNVERVEGGFRATGQVVRVADGTVLCEAEGFVGDDEQLWQKRPVFARRAMAQTRAISRACRSAFAFVVTLMDAGLETTPAEEMTGVDVEPLPTVIRNKPKPPAPQEDPVGKARLAVSKVKDIDGADALRELITLRTAEGKFTSAEHDELVHLLHMRVEQIIGTQEAVA